MSKLAIDLLRHRVLRTSRLVTTFIVTPYLSWMLLVGDPSRKLVLAITLLVHLVALLLSWTALARHIEGQAVLIAAYFCILGAAGIINQGPLLGSGAMLLTAVVWCLFFFGTRGALLGMIVTASQIVVLAKLCLSGVLAPPRAPPLLALDWVRVTTSFVLIATIVSLILGHALESLSGALVEAEDALAREARAHAERIDAERSLAQAQRLEALGWLAGGIAHDVNNALTVILANADRLSGEGSDASARGAAQDILSAGKTARDTIRHMLGFIRRDAEHVSAFPLSRLVARMATSLRRFLPEQVELEVDDRATGQVRVDEALFEQAILNLVINARDAMPDGGTLRLSTRDEERGGEGMVLVEVTDTGEGMPPEVARRIFEPLFTTKAVGRGTGLGLTMVQRFVRRSGGTIDVESAPGSGTTFRVCFFAVPAEDHTVPADERCDDMRVLLIEEDETVGRARARALRTAGATVFTASGVEGAREILRSAGEVDVLCTDAVLPQRIPLGPLLAEFRALGGRDLIVCTGHSDDDLVPLGVATGKASLLRKPFTARELVRAIALARTSSARGDPARS